MRFAPKLSLANTSIRAALNNELQEAAKALQLKCVDIVHRSQQQSVTETKEAIHNTYASTATAVDTLLKTVLNNNTEEGRAEINRVLNDIKIRFDQQEARIKNDIKIAAETKRLAASEHLIGAQMADEELTAQSSEQTLQSIVKKLLRPIQNQLVQLQTNKKQNPQQQHQQQRHSQVAYASLSSQATAATVASYGKGQSVTDARTRHNNTQTRSNQNNSNDHKHPHDDNRLDGRRNSDQNYKRNNSSSAKNDLKHSKSRSTWRHSSSKNEHQRSPHQDRGRSGIDEHDEQKSSNSGRTSRFHSSKRK